MNTLQIVGAIAVIVLIVMVGFMSGKKVSTASDFTNASGRGSTLLVVGIALATLIGGATTVGTTQTAFNFGLAGWWYTLGSSAGFLILALIMSEKLRNGGHQTMVGMISDEFGLTAEIIACFVLYTSMAISLASQMVSSVAVLISIFPALSNTAGLIICFILTIICVVYGGSLSAGNAGKLKTLLVFLVIVIGGLFVLKLSGISSLKQALDNNIYFNLFSRGTGYELSNGIATAMGICCSQANVSAVLSARDQKTARNGMFICAVLMPIIGLGSVLIGMFMKANHPDIAATMAFSRFLLDHLPSLLSGISIGTLFIALILSAAGTALGCSTVFTNNMIKPFVKKESYKEKELFYLRATMLMTLLLATIAGSGIFGDSVLSFAFLSMDLRSTTLVIPFILAVFFRGRADRRLVVLAEIVGPVSVIFFGLTKIAPIDELYIGMLLVIVLAVIAIAVRKKTE